MLRTPLAHALLLLAVSANAATMEIRVSIDSDNNASTGCSGIEQVLITSIEITESSASVRGVTRQLCSGGTFGSPSTINAGSAANFDSASRNALIESRIPYGLFGGRPPQTRFEFSLSSGTVSSVLTTNDSRPIIFPPAAGRRRAAITPAVSGSTRAIVVDGQGADWIGITPIARGRASNGPNALELLAVYVYAGESDFFFRFDATIGVKATAVDDSYDLAQGSTLNVAGPGVLANDSNPAGSQLSAIKSSDPSSGTVTLFPDGGFIYVHDGRLVPSDTFHYKAVTSSGESNAARVTLNIIPNIAPAATNDSYSVSEGGTLTVAAPGVLANDSDADGNPISAVIETSPSNGTLTLNADGSFTYTHNGSNTISDSFTYRASDGIAQSNIATVSITVTPVNDAPMANNDAYTTSEDATLTVSAPGVLGNDSDADSAGLTASILTNGALGIAALNANGSFTYIPNANANGADTFTYRVSDGTAISNIGTVTITITPVNDAPSFTGGGNVTVAEDSGAYSAVWAMAVSAGPADESAQALLFNVSNDNNPLFSAQPAIAPNGTLTFTPATNRNGAATVTVSLTDGGSNSANVNFTITVTAVNDPPAVSTTTFSIAENSANGTTVGAVSFADPDASDTATFAITGGNSGGAFAIDATTGQITVSNNAALDRETTPAFSLTVTVTDSGNAIGSATITITVTDVNEPPAFTSSATPNVPENTTAVVTVTATDPEGSSVTYSISGGADAALFSIHPTTGGLTFSIAPNFEGASNVYAVVVTASDGTNSPMQAITVTVTDVNESPAFTSSASASVAENTTAVLTVTTTDPEGNSVTYSISGGADAALFSIHPTTGALTFNIAPNFEGATNLYDVIVTASDGTNAPTQAIAVTVTDVNEPPLFTSSATPNVPENTTAVITVTASDPEGTGVTYSITGGADAALFSIHPTTGALAFNTAPNFEGATNVYDVIVTASDGTHVPTQAISVTVTDVNEAPVFTSSATASVSENTTAVLTVTTTDPEGNSITYSIGGGPDAALFSIHPTSGVLTFMTPRNFEAPADAGANNVYDVIVIGSDATNNPAQLISVTVTNVNEPPSIITPVIINAQELGTAVADVQSIDPEGETEGAGLTYSLSGGIDQAFFSIVPATGVLTFNTAPNFEAPADADANNEYIVQVTVTDSGSLSGVRTFFVRVTDFPETAVWEGDVDGSWTTPGNWLGNQPPGPNSPVNFTQSATFNPTTNSPGFPLGSVTMSGPFTGTVSQTQPLTVNGVLSIGAGTIFATNGNALTVAGLISGGGTLNATGGTVTTGGGLTVTTFVAGTSLTFNGTGNWSGASNFGNVSIMGAVTVTTMSPVSAGSVTVDSTALLSLQGDTTFNGALSVSGTLRANANAITIRFASGSIASFNAGSTVTIAPPSGFTDLLATASPAQWQLQLAAGVTQTFTRVRVQDSDVIGAVNPVATPATSFHLGGSDLFPAVTPGWENLQ